ncbi:hypothetical protein SRHO_G00264060 [Serrasalmus rhombeus]
MQDKERLLMPSTTGLTLRLSMSSCGRPGGVICSQRLSFMEGADNVVNVEEVGGHIWPSSLSRPDGPPRGYDQRSGSLHTNQVAEVKASLPTGPRPACRQADMRHEESTRALAARQVRI